MKVAKTTYEKLGFQDCPKCFPGDIVEATDDEIIAYLDESADHAILVATKDRFIAVWRGWRGDHNDFYVQDVPLESKAQAEGGNINAMRALVIARERAELEVDYAEGVGNS